MEAPPVSSTGFVSREILLKCITSSNLCATAYYRINPKSGIHLLSKKVRYSHSLQFLPFSAHSQKGPLIVLQWQFRTPSYGEVGYIILSKKPDNNTHCPVT